MSISKVALRGAQERLNQAEQHRARTVGLALRAVGVTRLEITERTLEQLDAARVRSSVDRDGRALIIELLEPDVDTPIAIPLGDRIRCALQILRGTVRA